MIDFFNKKKSCVAVEFIYNYARNRKFDQKRKRTYRCVANHLSNFEKNRGVVVCSDNYSFDLCEDFVYYLKSVGLMHNTVRTYIQLVASIFRRMSKKGYDVDFSFEDIQIGKERITKVYLTSEEIESIYSLIFKNPTTEAIRDLFVIGCLTGMRYSDFSNLSSANINGNNIVRKTKKTGENIIVPQHRIIKEILKKRNGEFPIYRKSDFNFNKSLKAICKRAKIKDKVLLEYTKGMQVVRKTVAKFELVSSHTARRSFATNASLAGIPTARIMLFTGHKTEQSFFEYVCILKQENARILAEHIFFN
jgi:integrase